MFLVDLDETQPLVDKLIENGSVLVEGNLIKQVSAGPIAAPEAFTLDGEGRTLMPGLIDMHAHLCLRDGIPWARVLLSHY